MSQNIAVVLRAYGSPAKLHSRVNMMINLADDPMSLHFHIILDEADPDLLSFSQVEYETNVHREYIILKSTNELKEYISKLPSQGYRTVIWGNVDDKFAITQHWDTQLRQGLGK